MTDRFVVVPAAYVFLLRPAPMPGGREVLLQLRRGTGYMDEHWAAASPATSSAASRSSRRPPGRPSRRSGSPTSPSSPGAPCSAPASRACRSTSGSTTSSPRRRWSGTPRIVEPDKCADLRWFNLDALPAPVVPHELRVLESIRAGSTPAILTHGF